MVRVTLNITQPQDLALLLQLAQRLGITYTQESIKVKEKIVPKLLRDKQLALLRQADKDPLFRSDVEEVTNDFAHADQDEL